MGLAECLDVQEPGSGKCKLATIRGNMSPEDAAVLDEWLASEMSSKRIAKALKAYGKSCSSTTIGAHRGSLCPCYTA